MTIVSMAVNSGSTTSLSNGNELVASITMVSAPTKLGSSGFTLRSMTLSPVTSLGNESDLDGDGIPNDLDEDDDNDGVIDSEDAFPLDPNESEDTDGDGVGNNSDDDDDGDGYLDDDEINASTDPLDANSYPREDEQAGTGMPIWLYFITTESSKASKHPE